MNVVGSLRPGSPAGLLDLRPLPFRLEPTPSGAAGRRRRPARDRRGRTLPQECREPVAGRSAIAVLGTMFRGLDREDGAGEPARQHREKTSTQGFVERRGVGQIEAQLHPRVGSVHPLPAGTGRMREAFDEVGSGHREAAWHPGTRANVQIVHDSSVIATATV